MNVLTVEADPLFGDSGHELWGADCPTCGQYWESPDTFKEKDPITCHKCEAQFLLIYPGDKEV